MKVARLYHAHNQRATSTRSDTTLLLSLLLILLPALQIQEHADKQAALQEPLITTSRTTTDSTATPVSTTSTASSALAKSKQTNSAPSTTPGQLPLIVQKLRRNAGPLGAPSPFPSAPLYDFWGSCAQGRLGDVELYLAGGQQPDELSLRGDRGGISWLPLGLAAAGGHIAVMQVSV